MTAPGEKITAADFEGQEIPFNLHQKIRLLLADRDSKEAALKDILSLIETRLLVADLSLTKAREALLLKIATATR